MNSLETEVERAFRESVGEMPYCSLSVKGLCERAGVSRKMFYKRFGGKGDVLRFIFSRDVVDPQLELCRLLSFEKMGSFGPQMVQHMFRAVVNDGDFYRAVVQAPQGGQGAFAAVASDSLYGFYLVLLREYHYRGADPKPDYIARFFADAEARMMAKWLREDFRLTSEEASMLFSRMALPFWKSLVKASR